MQIDRQNLWDCTYIILVLIGAMLGGLPVLLSEAEGSPGTICVPDDYLNNSGNGECC
jgi:hypothetical protein